MIGSAVAALWVLLAASAAASGLAAAAAAAARRAPASPLARAASSAQQLLSAHEDGGLGDGDALRPPSPGGRVAGGEPPASAAEAGASRVQVGRH